METPSHFPEIRLTPVEARVLGCLLEKEATTPAYYPLTLNSLQTACNQTSNRNPVTHHDERTVEKALVGLRLKGLVLQLQAAGARALKYKHTLSRCLEIDAAQTALLTILLLRGVQTAGELKQRCERMHEFASVEAVEESLQWFLEYPHGPLVVRHPAGGGRRVETYEHLLCDPTPDAIPENDIHVDPIAAEPPLPWQQQMEQRVEQLAAAMQELQAMVESLRDNPPAMHS